MNKSLSIIMSFRNKIALLLLATGAVFSSVVTAELVPLEYSPDVTLSSLTEYVYEHHPKRHNELARQQQANANTALAESTFAGAKTVNLRHQNDFVGSSDGLQEWEASVDVPLWLSGQKQTQLQLSDKLLAELPAYQQQIRLEASQIVRELIWHIIRTNNATQQAYQVWQTAKKLERDVIARVKAGELAGTEQLLANTNVIEMHSQYVLAQAELEHALTSYRRYTGEQTLPKEFEESLTINVATNEQHHSTTEVMPGHPSLKMWDQRIDTLRAKQEIAHFDRAVNPVVSVGVRSERGDRTEKFNNSIGVGISLAFDDTVYRKPAVADAARELANAEMARLQLERDLNITVFTQLHDLETKRQQLKLVIEQDTTTKQYLALQQRAFDLGEIDLVSLLRTQALANESHNRKLAIEIEIKYLIATVNQAIGVAL
ncbi:MAG: TolC family protein [Methylophaga sp.]|nr:TolC family protein [Methylophaga sp.]